MCRLLLVLVFAGAAAGDHAQLNVLLEEREKYNKLYKDQFLDLAKKSEYAEQLTRYETGVADGWLALLQYAKKSDDPELKKIVLRIEYNDELRGYIGHLENADTDEKRAQMKQGIEAYENRLKTTNEQ